MNYWVQKKTNIKLASRPVTFLKRNSNTGVFCGICETFKNSHGCFWKHVIYYYIIKNYLGHKLVSSKLSFYSIAFIVNLIMRHETQAWCGVHNFERNELTAETWARNKKKYCSCCIVLIRIDIILPTNI